MIFTSGCALDALDPRSIGITLSLSGIALTAVLWAARRDGGLTAGLDAWVVCAAWLALGIGLSSLQGVLPEWLSRVLGNVLMIGSVILAWKGAREFRGLATSHRLLLAVCCVSLLWSVVFIYVWPSAKWRVVCYSLSMAAACALAGWEFLQHRQPHLRAAARFGAYPLFVFGALMIARAVDAFRRTDVTSALNPTPVNIATYLLGSVVLLAVIASMVMSVNAMRSAQVREVAYRDGLTGALSRLGLYASFPRWIGTHSPGSTVAILDANRFKQINDTHGHAVGDQVLKLLVDTCREHLPPDCLIARFGGDEFVVLLPPDADATALLAVVASKFCGITTQTLPQLTSIKPTVAIGHATLLPAADTEVALDLALKQADAVMYADKALTRN